MAEKIYYEGPFWIEAKSFKDILKGEFDLAFKKIPISYDGNVIGDDKVITHVEVWDYMKDCDIHSYKYYPRGAVSVYKGDAFIHIPYQCNTQLVIDRIVKEFSLNNVYYEVDCSDDYFELE